MEKLKRFLDNTAPLNAGNFPLNALGYQFFRIAWQNKSRLKPKSIQKRYQKDLAVLQDKGILIVPDFLPKDVFLALRKEYETHYAKNVGVNKKAGQNTDFQDYFSNMEEFFDVYRSEITDKYFSNSDYIRSLVSAASGKSFGQMPSALFWTLKKVNKDIDKAELRKQHSSNYLHADVAYPAFKVFFYLNDVDVANGAFTFVPGSHKLTMKRLKLEYKLSCLFTRGRPYGTITDEEAKELGFVEMPVCAKANTLVLFNAMGFHRRGEFSSDKPRETIHMDFRFLYTIRNALKAVFKKVS